MLQILSSPPISAPASVTLPALTSPGLIMVTGPAVRMVDIVLSSSSAPDLFYLGRKLPGVEAGDLPDQLVHVVHIVSDYRDHAGLQEVGGEQLEGLAALD